MICEHAPIAAPPAKAALCIISIDMPSLYTAVIITIEIVLPTIAKKVLVIIKVLSNAVVAYRAQLKRGQHSHKINVPMVAKVRDL